MAPRRRRRARTPKGGLPPDLAREAALEALPKAQGNRGAIKDPAYAAARQGERKVIKALTKGEEAPTVPGPVFKSAFAKKDLPLLARLYAISLTRSEFQRLYAQARRGVFEQPFITPARRAVLKAAKEIRLHERRGRYPAGAQFAETIASFFLQRDVKQQADLIAIERKQREAAEIARRAQEDAFLERRMRDALRRGRFRK